MIQVFISAVISPLLTDRHYDSESKSKCRIVPVHALKSYKKSRVVASAILNLGPWCNLSGWCHNPRCFTQGKQPMVQLSRRLGGPQSLTGC